MHVGQLCSARVVRLLLLLDLMHTVNTVLLLETKSYPVITSSNTVSTVMVLMSEKRLYNVGRVKMYAVWTSETSGDLFKSDSIEITQGYVLFFLSKSPETPTKSYKLADFIRYNLNLFESITLGDG
jgi:hypothetical protein